MFMLMMKGLLSLNVNNTVLHFCLSKTGGQKLGSTLPKCIIKEVNKGQKSYHRSRIGQNAGQKGSKILPKRRSYQKWVKKEVKKGQRSTGVVNVNGKPSLKTLNVNELLLMVPIVVMLLVLNTSTVFGP